MSEKIENNWPAFEIESWKSIPIVKGKIATEIEAEKGLAIFFLKNTNTEHKAYEIDLPQLAYLTNENDEEKVLIVLVQAESTSQGTIIGYRNPKGGNGACFLEELVFLSSEEIEKLVRK